MPTAGKKLRKEESEYYNCQFKARYNFFVGGGHVKQKFLVSFCVISLLLVVFSKGAEAVPPLVAGDVPTADKNHVEWFIGMRYQKTGTLERQIPFTELVYGVSERQELTFEIPYLSIDGNHGFGDAVLGTKFQFIKETDRIPGVAGSFELKLDNASQTKGLGTGAKEYDLRLRSQKSWAWFTGLINIGCTFVGEPKIEGVHQKRDNVLFTAFAQEFEIDPKTKILSEIYWKNSDEPSGPDRFAFDVGFKHHLFKHLALHAAVGKSLREDNLEGPDLRVYAGMKIEFPVIEGMNP